MNGFKNVDAVTRVGAEQRLSTLSTKDRYCEAGASKIGLCWLDGRYFPNVKSFLLSSKSPFLTTTGCGSISASTQLPAWRIELRKTGLYPGTVVLSYFDPFEKRLKMRGEKNEKYRPFPQKVSTIACRHHAGGTGSPRQRAGASFRSSQSPSNAPKVVPPAVPQVMLVRRDDQILVFLTVPPARTDDRAGVAARPVEAPHTAPVTAVNELESEGWRAATNASPAFRSP